MAGGDRYRNMVHHHEDDYHGGRYVRGREPRREKKQYYGRYDKDERRRSEWYGNGRSRSRRDDYNSQSNRSRNSGSSISQRLGPIKSSKSHDFSKAFRASPKRNTATQQPATKGKSKPAKFYKNNPDYKTNDDIRVVDKEKELAELEESAKKASQDQAEELEKAGSRIEPGLNVNPSDEEVERQELDCDDKPKEQVASDEDSSEGAEGEDDAMGKVHPFSKKNYKKVMEKKAQEKRVSIQDRLGHHSLPSAKPSGSNISRSKSSRPSASQQSASSTAKPPIISSKKKRKKAVAQAKKRVRTALAKENGPEQWSKKIVKRHEAAAVGMKTPCISVMCKNPSKPRWEEIRGEVEGAGFWNVEEIRPYGVVRKIGSCFKFFKKHKEEAEHKIQTLTNELAVSKKESEVYKGQGAASQYQVESLLKEVEGYKKMMENTEVRVGFLTRQNDQLTAGMVKLEQTNKNLESRLVHLVDANKEHMELLNKRNRELEHQLENIVEQNHILGGVVTLGQCTQEDSIR